MVKFLLNRPIAVVMAFLAAVIIGSITYFALPVSLLPGIDIPQITVQISGEGVGARELENTVTAPVRRQLLQVGGLTEIKSETRDGLSLIRLHFDYGVNTDLAFIEVNEKIDAAMNSLPRETQRPKAIKASATDIPVLYLNMTLKDDHGNFNAMAELAENVICRRIEQLPQVAMADVTGIPKRQLQITPDRNAMSALGVETADIENAISLNNSAPGSMTVRNGYYEYNINIANNLRSPQDVEKILLRKGGRLMPLGDFCRVEMTDGTPDGYSYCNGKRAVTLAIIKQSDESMGSLKESLRNTIDYFADLYPEIEFTESRNQTELLDYTISNLVQNLILGFLLVFVLTALFMGDVRSSMVIGIAIVSSIVITFLLFYMCDISINIISLSGLILAVGMMIDNSVIVTENIAQCRQRGIDLTEACDLGTTEMITPMLSSSLTTVAVFVPLVFMSGIAGAIFRDQAFAITAGLAVSYIVGIMLLPVLYRIFFSSKSSRSSCTGSGNSVNDRMSQAYMRIIDLCFRHKLICLTLTALTIPACVWLFTEMPVERMPRIDRNETVVRVEWNENITLHENARRMNRLLSAVDTSAVALHSAYVGAQDYLLDAGSSLSITEAEIYIRAHTPEHIKRLNLRIDSLLAADYPLAAAEYLPAENIFEKIFSSDEAELEARLYSHDKARETDFGSLLTIEGRVTDETTPMRDRLRLVIDREKLLLYNVGYNDLLRILTTAFKGNSIGTLRSYQQYIPIAISDEESTVEQVLGHTLVNNIPLSAIVKVEREQDLKEITAGADGEYIPLVFNGLNDPEVKMTQIREVIDQAGDWEVDFAGSIFSNRRMMRELIVILLVSVLLMYFILCAQFGSFVQPLIVLCEIPIDTAFALITLWAFGQTLNLMSAIGIIVTCGIVVNDSILKIDAINELRARGMPLMEAIHTAGVRRLRPIIMTSLTTILAMVPILFTRDMGSELQQPMAIAMIGSMVIGTLVSIFIIPIIYWLIYNKDAKATA